MSLQKVLVAEGALAAGVRTYVISLSQVSNVVMNSEGFFLERTSTIEMEIE